MILLIIFGILLFLYIFSLIYKLYAFRINFDHLNKYFPRANKWENDLQIFNAAMPLYYTKDKKKNKCILLISGFRDVPFVWSEIIIYFEKNELDYYAPRTHGSGRNFYQKVDPMDWVITYLEAIKILEKQYEQIDIIGFSAGCIIALYLSQFKYECKIRNIILCAPYLVNNTSMVQYLVFHSYWSYLINPLVRFFIPYRIKYPCTGFTCSRDSHYSELAEKDFYDKVGYFEMENLLMSFKNTRPSFINADKILMLYPNNDHVIGNIFTQKNIVEHIFKKKIPLIKIPSTSDELCGHVMFKENPNIIENIFDEIKFYLK